MFCYSPPSVRPPPPDSDDLLISPPPPLLHSTLFRSYLVDALLVPPQRQYTRTVRNCGMRSFGRDVCPTSRSARGDLRAGEHARESASAAVSVDRGRRRSASLSFPFTSARLLPRFPIRLPVNKHLGNCPIQQSAEGRGRGAGKVGRAMQKLFFPSSSSVLGVRDVLLSALSPSFTHERAWLHRTLLEGYLISLDISQVPTDRAAG